MSVMAKITAQRVAWKIETFCERIERSLKRSPAPRVFFSYRGDYPHPMLGGLWEFSPIPYVNIRKAEIAHWIQGPRTMAVPFLVEPIDHPLSPVRVSEPAENLAQIERVADLYRDTRCRRILLVSEGQQRLLERYFPDPAIVSKAVIVPPCVRDPGSALYGNSYFPQNEGEGPTFCCIASHYVAKGVRFLVEAWSEFYAKHQKARLLLVCHDAPNNLKIEGCRLIRQIPLSTRERDALHRASDVLIFLTLTDGISAIDGLAYGLGLITYRMQHSSDFVSMENGFEIPVPVNIYDEGYGTEWRTSLDYLRILEERRTRGEFNGTVAALTQVLTRYAEDPVLLSRHRKASRELFAQHYSPETRKRRVLEVYAAALGKNAQKKP